MHRYALARLLSHYFHEKTGSLLCTALHKVTKPAESLNIKTKYVKVCFLQQGLIPGFLGGVLTIRPHRYMKWAKFHINILFLLPLHIPATVILSSQYQVLYNQKKSHRHVILSYWVLIGRYFELCFTLKCYSSELSWRWMQMISYASSCMFLLVFPTGGDSPGHLGTN